MQTEIVLVDIGAFGIIKKGLDNYVEKIAVSISFTEIQKITLLETAHILNKVLSIINSLLPKDYGLVPGQKHQQQQQ